MPIICLLAFVSALLLQGTGSPSIEDDIFLPRERVQLEKAENVERRIKVYEAASKRIQKTLEAAVTKEKFQVVPNTLRLWMTLLSTSLEDIEANLRTKKKSRALINYEIQVRKSIARTESLKIHAPVDQQDIFDSCISEAETVRKQFIEILFRH